MRSRWDWVSGNQIFYFTFDGVWTVAFSTDYGNSSAQIDFFEEQFKKYNAYNEVVQQAIDVVKNDPMGIGIFPAIGAIGMAESALLPPEVFVDTDILGNATSYGQNVPSNSGWGYPDMLENAFNTNEI